MAKGSPNSYLLPFFFSHLTDPLTQGCQINDNVCAIDFIKQGEMRFKWSFWGFSRVGIKFA
jgi:hypothetical protein